MDVNEHERQYQTLYLDTWRQITVLNLARNCNYQILKELSPSSSRDSRNNAL
jgi:hypothetical protein